MFGTELNVWLQSWSSSGLTGFMNVISLLGYSPVYMAIAVVLAFAVRLRAGAALLFLLALNGVIVDTTKTLARFPRPDAVDARVVNLELSPRHIVETVSHSIHIESAMRSLEAEDGYGFPSGHVAAATVFFSGLVWLFRWRWAWSPMAIWVFVMALSRMYLGRHFLGDVIGGVGVGILAMTLARRLNLDRLDDMEGSPRIARRLVVIGCAAAICAFVSTIPAPHYAGRLLGFGIGALLLLRHDGSDDDVAGPVRLARILLAFVLFPVLWWSTLQSLEIAGWSHTSLGAFVAGTLPAALAVPGPLFLQAALRFKR